MPPLPPITRNLLIALVAIWALQHVPVVGPLLEQWGMLWPVQSGLFMPWQLVTYAFLHSPNDIGHLFFNALGLVMFGSDLERIWGHRRYLAFLLASTVTAGLTQLLLAGVFGNLGPTLGASGALFGLLIANAMLFPRRQLLLFFVVPVAMTTGVLIFGVLELVMGVSGGGGVAHFAHLGGMLGGWLTIRYWRRQAPFGWRKR
jgi:membrane associated rhomboid family serine protease